MEEENIKTLKQLEEEAKQALEQPVKPDNPLKEMFVEYIGSKYGPADGVVTVEMCVEVLAEEFPEFLAPVCEQNFMIGYTQCEKDMTAVLEAYRSLETQKEDEPEEE